MKKSSSTTHVPFAELDIAHRFFYWIGANTTVGLLRPWPPTMKEIGADIIRIWDEQKFAPPGVVEAISTCLYSLLSRKESPHPTL